MDVGHAGSDEATILGVCVSNDVVHMVDAGEEEVQLAVVGVCVLGLACVGRFFSVFFSFGATPCKKKLQAG